MQVNQPDDIFFDADIYESQFTYAFPGPAVPFWIYLAKNFGPKVLELACGTARVTIPVFESGVAVDGIDFSESMLRLARKHAEAKSLKINFLQGDLRSLPFQDQYDLMYLPTVTISHLLTRADVEAFLSGVRRGLHKSRILALDVHNPMRIFLKSWPLDPAGTESSFTHRVTGETIRVLTTKCTSRIHRSSWLKTITRLRMVRPGMGTLSCASTSPPSCRICSTTMALRYGVLMGIIRKKVSIRKANGTGYLRNRADRFPGGRGDGKSPISDCEC